MKKIKRIVAIILAVFTLMSTLCLSSCSSGNAEYEVKVVDGQGNACAEGVIVKFLQDGAQVAMQPVDKDGTVKKELAKGDYNVELVFTDSSINGYFDKESAVLSADDTKIEIILMNGVNGEPSTLYAKSPVTGENKDYHAYDVGVGSTYVSLEANERNYFLFVPKESGTYRFSVDNKDNGIGYYGAPHFVQSVSAADVKDNSFTISVSNSNIGGDGGGTSTFVIGVDGGETASDCILSIVRIGDAEHSIADEPWTEYNTTCEITPFTLDLATDESLTYVNIEGKTDDYVFVKNESDGYYHLGAEDGPIIYVHLGKGAPFVSLQTVIMGDGHAGGAPIRKYFFDEDNNFIKKEDYTDILTSYFENMDEKLYIYPLNDDLIYIIKNGCEGWWTESSPDYIFDGCNSEIGWMFACCYVG